MFAPFPSPSSPQAYPVMGVIVFAVAFCTGTMIYFVSTMPDARVRFAFTLDLALRRPVYPIASHIPLFITSS